MVQVSIILLLISSLFDIDVQKSIVSDVPPSYPFFDTTNVTSAYIMGKFDPASHPDFRLIPKKYADQKGRFIRKDVFEAYKKMYHAAKKDGVHLIIISATRNFDAQKKIWEDKWTGKRLLEGGIHAQRDIPDPKKRALKILEYSSMPGTSRHHWGTDIDINALNNEYFEKGEGMKVITWLLKNSASYGFCMTYTKFDPQRTTGYQPEKWHWSYTPVSAPLTHWAKRNIKDTMITGFEGSETATEIKVVQNYISGIHPSCLPSPN
ncbi:MAG: M15 family metallopeptidase [Saprospiraceae bacterium]|nr:M15 family metallopeptidase [Saprospiraceae bacterium]